MLVAVAVAGSYYTYTSNSNVEEAELLMANVEALATEADVPTSDKWPCWSDVKDGGGVWVCGAPCEWKANKNKNKGEGECHK